MRFIQGNSIIRGPEDVVREMNRRIGTSFPCSEPHNLTFLIGGKPFPVDPRDFLLQERSNSVAHCISNVAATDPPAVGGYLFSWSLGIPFLKGCALYHIVVRPTSHNSLIALYPHFILETLSILPETLQELVFSQRSLRMQKKV